MDSNKTKHKLMPLLSFRVSTPASSKHSIYVPHAQNTYKNFRVARVVVLRIGESGTSLQLTRNASHQVGYG